MQALRLSTPKMGNRVPKGTGTGGQEGVWLAALFFPRERELSFPREIPGHPAQPRADFGLLWPSRGASLTEPERGGERGSGGEEAKEERDKKEKATGDKKPQASK
jgi:hypothetical protein